MEVIFDQFQEVYPNLKDCAVQAIHDVNKSNPLVKKHMSKVTYDELLKDNEKGYAIFFSVNSMKVGKRSIKDVTHVNAWIAECDNKTKEEQLAMIKDCPIKPSIIVESKKSFHMYWFAEDGNIKNWKSIGKGLTAYFDGDKAVGHDISTLIRLPGFYHQKDPKNKFLVNMFNDPDGEYCSFSSHKEVDMMKAYPAPMDEIERPKKRANKPTSKGHLDMWELMESWDSVMMLERLSSTGLINGESISFVKNSGKFQIAVNGKETGCRIDDDGRIGSNDKGGPTWIQWVLRYRNIDKTELLRWTIDNCQDLIPNGYKEKKAIERVIKKKVNEDLFAKTPYTWGIKYTPEWLGFIGRQDLVTIAGYPAMGKTEFTYFIAQKNAAKGVKTLYISLEMTEETMRQRMAMNKAKISKYKLQTGDYSKEQKDLMLAEMKRIAEIENLKIIGYEGRPTADTVCETITKYHGLGYDLFFIDNLGYFTGKGKEIDIQGDVTQQLRLLVNQLDTAVVLLHHLNKPSRKEGIQKPGGLGAIRGNQKIIDNSTLVFEIRRDQDSFSEQRDSVSLILNKDTIGGNTGIAKLRYIGDGGYEMFHQPNIYEQAEYNPH